MAEPQLVDIPPQEIARFKPLLGDAYDGIEAAAARGRSLFAGRKNWHVSSTEYGGGVAEMLHALLPYVRDAGIDTRWVVLQEQPEFFELTKRLHNNLHGTGGPLSDDDRALYEGTLAESARDLIPLFGEGDVVFFHDPQTAGLVPAAKRAGAVVVWRCHIGVDHADRTARQAWNFLAPYVREADAFVFSRRQYVWDVLDPDRAWLLAPCIDPFSPKNQELEPATVAAIVDRIGVGTDPGSAAPAFIRADGAPGTVERPAEILQDERLPTDAVAVVQISRWDRLKDHRGLLACFERSMPDSDRHLLLVGPAAGAVSDDPEGATVWEELVAAWRRLPGETRRRVHLISLPMDDRDENAAMVNALQRRADVVVQNSLAEGFGLTVAEAMWKSRPVIGTRVGGIQDQIVDGVSGLLIDPGDLDALAAAIAELTGDPALAAAMGAEARQRVFERFLGPVRLAEYLELVAALAPRGPR